MDQTPTPVEEPPKTVKTIVPEGSVATPPAAPLTDKVQDIDPQVAEKRGGAEQELENLRADMGITENVDPLQALLKAPIGPQSGDWPCRRLGVTFKIKSLDNEVYAKAQEQATRFVRNRRTGRMEKDIDGAMLSFLVVVAGCTNPSFENQQVLAKYKSMGPQDAVKKALLPGEVDGLAEKILQLSGFDEDVEEQGKD